MLSRTMKAVRRRLGPVGLSLAAAALTAVAFAAVSVAQDDSGKSDDAKPEAGATVFEHRVGPPDLSAEDKKAFEEFRSCMEENGAPAPPTPPDPSDLKEGERPERPDPPSEADQEKIQKAMEACKDELPEGAHIGFGGPCGPPPGAPGERGDDDAAIPGPPPGSDSQQSQAPSGSGA